MKIYKNIFKISKKYFVLLFFTLSMSLIYAQRDLGNESVVTPIYGLTYKGSFSGGDFAKKWGYTNALGAEFNIKFKNNVSFGLESQFMFGNSFKDFAIFDNLKNENDKITSFSGAPGDILYLLRGANVTGHIGYLFNKVNSDNKNSGIWVNFGLGYMVHKIRIEFIHDKIDQFKGDYIKGYDKLSMGIASKQFIGYLQHNFS